LIWTASRLAIAGLCSHCLVAPPVLALEWRVEPAFSVASGYTDNVELAPKGNEESDLGTGVRLSSLVGANGPGGHLNASLQLDGLKFFQDSSHDDVRVDVGAEATAELLDEWLHVEAQTIVREVFANPRFGVSLSEFNDPRNRVLTQAYRLNPFARHSFGGWASIEAGYSLSYEDAEFREVRNSLTQQFTALVTSGERFSRFSWAMTLDHEDSDREIDDGAKRSLAVWDVSYAALRGVSLLGGFGAEDIRDDSLPERISGAVGYAGIAYEPNSRCSFRATVGHRFDRTVFSTDARLEVGPKTEIRLRFDEGFQTSQRLIRSSLGFLGTDPEGKLIDVRNSRPLVVGDRAFGLVPGTFFQERIAASLRRISQRNVFHLEVFGERRDFPLTDTDDEAVGVDVDWRRLLNRRATLDVQLRYTQTHFGGAFAGRERQTVVGVGLTYLLSSSVAVSASYYISHRNGVADLNDLRENSIILGIRKSFGPGPRAAEQASARRLSGAEPLRAVTFPSRGVLPRGKRRATGSGRPR
jgi:hypothetical protein